MSSSASSNLTSSQRENRRGTVQFLPTTGEILPHNSSAALHSAAAAAAAAESLSSPSSPSASAEAKSSSSLASRALDAAKATFGGGRNQSAAAAAAALEAKNPRGEKAVAYIQGMLERRASVAAPEVKDVEDGDKRAGGRRRSVDWEAMPKRDVVPVPLAGGAKEEGGGDSGNGAETKDGRLTAEAMKNGGLGGEQASEAEKATLAFENKAKRQWWLDLPTSTSTSTSTTSTVPGDPSRVATSALLSSLAPTLSTSLQSLAVPSSMHDPTILAALTYSPYEVQNWSNKAVILFLGRLGIHTHDVDRYRAIARKRKTTGKDILTYGRNVFAWCDPEALDSLPPSTSSSSSSSSSSCPSGLTPFGFDAPHASAMSELVKAWRGDHAILSIPPDVDAYRKQYAPDYEALHNADVAARHEHGTGRCYGQLVVLGYKEYNVTQTQEEGEDGATTNRLVPVGQMNDKFPLLRRVKPNGIRRDRAEVKDAAFVIGGKGGGGQDASSNPNATHFVTFRVAEGNNGRRSSMAKTVVTAYVPDPALDMYQLGRLNVTQNDFCLRGPLTVNSSGQQCGPVSRYAARIMCSRLPPYDSYICAAGFSPDRDIFLGESAPKWRMESDESNAAGVNEEGQNRSYDWDAVTTFGLRVWLPSMKRWVEISVNGFMQEIRVDDAVGGKRIGKGVAKLEHGVVIDISGVQLIYQDYEHMRHNKPTEETIEKFYGYFDSLQMQCPVNLQTVRYGSAKNRDGMNAAAMRSKLQSMESEELEGVVIGRSSSVSGGIAVIGRSSSVVSSDSASAASPKKGETIASTSPASFTKGADLGGGSNAARAESKDAGVDAEEAFKKKVRDIEANDAKEADTAARGRARNETHFNMQAYAFVDDEEYTAGVFPACGHVVTYSTEMKKSLQICPLCRAMSDLRVLKIAYEPALHGADEPPTHVFNPCGCAASLKCCDFWGSLTMPNNAHPGYSNCAVCPFCASVLAETRKGSNVSYSKIITGHEVSINSNGEVTQLTNEAKR